GLVEAEVMELADRRVPGCAELAVGLGVAGADALRRLALCLGEHRVAPGPEVAARALAPKRALEGMRVGADESRQRERSRVHAGILTLSAQPRHYTGGFAARGERGGPPSFPDSAAPSPTERYALARLSLRHERSCDAGPACPDPECAHP